MDNQKESPFSGCSHITFNQEKILRSDEKADGFAGFPLAGRPLSDLLPACLISTVQEVTANGGAGIFAVKLKDRRFLGGIWPNDGVWTLALRPYSQDNSLVAIWINTIVRQLREQLSFSFGALGLLSNSIKSGDLERSGFYHAIMLKSSYQLERLTNNMSTLTSGDTSFGLVYSDLVTACRGIFESCEAHLEKSGVSLSFDSPSLSIPAYFDQSGLEHIFYNLISNAVQYGGDDVKIGVSVASEPGDGVASISVEDNGPGIAPDLIRRFFSEEPPDPTDLSSKITGLGLQMAGYIALRHSGYFRLTTRPGKTFCSVAIPARSGPPPDLPIRSGADYSGGLDHTLIGLSAVIPVEEFLEI